MLYLRANVRGDLPGYLATYLYRIQESVPYLNFNYYCCKIHRTRWTVTTNKADPTSVHKVQSMKIGPVPSKDRLAHSVSPPGSMMKIFKYSNGA